MKPVTNQIRAAVAESLQKIFNQSVSLNDFQINKTNAEFEGDYTVVLFSLLKTLKTSPDKLGNTLGSFLVQEYGHLFSTYNLIKGFLNLSLNENIWIDFLKSNYNNVDFGKFKSNGKKVIVEYSSPNTNKPLHLGHLRNNFLGWSIAELFKYNGYTVDKTCVVNDRGVHICKSMLAWQKFSNGATPESTNKKGDHFVGDYYVKFNDEYKKQIDALIAEGLKKEEAERQAPIMKETQEMLQQWEQGNDAVMQLWKKMNGWVYAGFDETYQLIGSDFDKIYYESETYLLGKKYVEAGLQNGVFIKKEDGSVWIDLTADGLDEKIILRKDGTSVYITQDIGLAKQKQEDFYADKSIYVIGDEQNYHMKVLKLICEKLNIPHSDGIYHLSYGMVELPTGKMKSREGTVVDADELAAEMIAIAEQKTKELGKVSGFTDDELKQLYKTIGLGALKFFLLRVDPKKKMIFNPEESIDIHGFTGPFVQYTYARIKSILRKTGAVNEMINDVLPLHPLEKELALALEQYPEIISDACNEMNPSLVAIYIFNVAKIFNALYADLSIANAESENKKQLRLMLSQLTANVIHSALQVLGIASPERM